MQFTQVQPGAQPAFHFGGEIFMKFHLIKSLCLFNRGKIFARRHEAHSSITHILHNAG